MPSTSTSNGQAANGANGNGHDEDLAIETRAELLRTLSVDIEHRHGESDQLHIGRGDSRDVVDGKETLRVGGSLTEESHARTVNAVRLETTITGKMHAHAIGDTTLVGGAVAETHHGPVALLAGMSDDLVAGGGLRISTPLDIWIASLMGIDEHIGTAIADAALVEASVAHFEREYGTGNHAAGLAVFNGQVYTTMATGFRPLWRVIKGVRDTSPGGGGGGGAPAAPPSGGGGAAAAGGGMLAGAGAAAARGAARGNVGEVLDIARHAENAVDIADTLDELADVGDVADMVARFDFEALADTELARTGDTLETLEELRTGVDELENARPLGSNSYTQGTLDFRELDEAGQLRYQAEFNEENWMELIGYTPPGSAASPEPPPSSAQEIADLNDGIAPLLRQNMKRKKFKKVDFTDVDSVRDAISQARYSIQVEVTRAEALKTAGLGDTADVVRWQAALDAFDARIDNWENSLRQLQNVALNPPTPPPAAAGPPPVWNFDDAFDALSAKSIDYRARVRWDGHIQLRQTQDALLDAARQNEALLRELMDPEDFRALTFMNAFNDPVNGAKRIRQALADLSTSVTDVSDLARVTEALESFDQFAEARMADGLQRAADADAVSWKSWPFEVDQSAFQQALRDEVTKLDESIQAIDDPAAQSQALMDASPTFNSYQNAIAEIDNGNNPLYQLDAEIRMSEFRLQSITNDPSLSDAKRAADIAAEQNQLNTLRAARTRISGLMSSHSLESADQILRRYQLAHGGSLIGAPGSPTTASNFQLDPFQVGRAGDLGDTDVSGAIQRFQEQLTADLFSNQVDAARVLNSADDELRQIGANFRPMLEAGLPPDEFARIDFDDFASIREGLETLANGARGDEALVARQALANYDRHIFNTIEAAMGAADDARGTAGNWQASQSELVAQALANKGLNYKEAADSDMAARYRILALATQSGSDPLQVLDDQIRRTQEWLATDNNPMVRVGDRVTMRPQSQRMRDQLATLIRMRAEVADLVSDIAPSAIVASGSDLVDVLSSAPVVAKTDAWDNLKQSVAATAEMENFKDSVGDSVRFVDGQGAAGSTAELLRADDLTSANGVITSADDAAPTTTPVRLDVDDAQPVVIDDASTVWAWPAPKTPLPDGIDKNSLGVTLRNSENAVVNPSSASDAADAVAARSAAFQMSLQRIDDGLDPIASLDESITLAKANGASDTQIQALEEVRRFVSETMSDEYIKGLDDDAWNVPRHLASPPPLQKGKKAKKGKSGKGIGTGPTIQLTDSTADMDFGPPRPLPERTPDDTIKIIDQNGEVVGEISHVAEPGRAAPPPPPPSTPGDGPGLLGGGFRSRWQRRRQRGARLQRAKRTRLRESGWRWRNPFNFRRNFGRRVTSLEHATDADVVVRLDAIEVEVDARPGTQTAADGADGVPRVELEPETGSPQAAADAVENDELQHVIEANEEGIYDNAYEPHVYDPISIPDEVEAAHYGEKRVHILNARNPDGYVNSEMFRVETIHRPVNDGFKPTPPVPDSGYKRIDTELDEVIDGKSTLGTRLDFFKTKKAQARARGRPKVMRAQNITVNADEWLAKRWAFIDDDGKIALCVSERTYQRIFGTFEGAGHPFDPNFRLDYTQSLEVTVVGSDGNVLPQSAWRVAEPKKPGSDQRTRLLAMIADHQKSYAPGGRQAKMQEAADAETAHRAFLMEMHHSDDWLNHPMPLPIGVAPQVEMVIDQSTGAGKFVRLPTPL